MTYRGEWGNPASFLLYLKYSSKRGYAVTSISLQRKGIKLSSSMLLLTQYPQPWAIDENTKCLGLPCNFWSGVIPDINTNSSLNLI